MRNIKYFEDFDNTFPDIPHKSVIDYDKIEKDRKIREDRNNQLKEIALTDNVEEFKKLEPELFKSKEVDDEIYKALRLSLRSNSINLFKFLIENFEFNIGHLKLMLGIAIEHKVQKIIDYISANIHKFGGDDALNRSKRWIINLPINKISDKEKFVILNKYFS